MDNVLKKNRQSSLRCRVDPFDIPGVKKIHYPGIFADFGENIDGRIAELESRKALNDGMHIDFFRFLRSEVDPEDYARIQAAYLSPMSQDWNPSTVKFLDPIYWFEGKMNAVLRIGLDKMPPIDILDLGTGCGHFPTIARFFGHIVLGTDIELKPTGPDRECHLYDALCKIYGVTKVTDRIYPFEEVTDHDRRFDMVTAFLAAFNVFGDKSPWSIEAWKFFFSSLQKNVLKPNGRVFFQLANDKLTDEVWQFLSSKAVSPNDTAKYLYIEDIESCT